MYLVFKIVERNSLDETFAAPSTTLAWKTSKSGKLITMVYVYVFASRLIVYVEALKEQVTQNPKYSHYLLIPMLMESWVKSKTVFFFSKSPVALRSEIVSKRCYLHPFLS